MPYSDPAEQKRASREHYLRNTRAIADRTAQRTKENKAYVRALKEASPCTDCKVFYPYYVMDYDHVRGKKTAGLAVIVKGSSLDTVKAEIEKCELVCANCHRIRTWMREAEDDNGPIIQR